MQVALPVLRVVHSLDRIAYLIRDEQTELHSDIVCREYILAGDELRCPAQVDPTNREVATPMHMATGSEQAHELTLVVEQADVAFRHDVRVINPANREDGENQQ